MLVLSRKRGEEVCVGAQITVTILRVKGRSVQIGIEAPAGVQILRGELVHSNGSRARGEHGASSRSAAVGGEGGQRQDGPSRRPDAAGQETPPAGEAGASADPISDMAAQGIGVDRADQSAETVIARRDGSAPAPAGEAELTAQTAWGAAGLEVPTG